MVLVISAAAPFSSCVRVRVRVRARARARARARVRVRVRVRVGFSGHLARPRRAEEVEDAEELADVRVSREEHRALVI